MPTLNTAPKPTDLNERASSFGQDQNMSTIDTETPGTEAPQSESPSGTGTSSNFPFRMTLNYGISDTGSRNGLSSPTVTMAPSPAPGRKLPMRVEEEACEAETSEETECLEGIPRADHRAATQQAHRSTQTEVQSALSAACSHDNETETRAPAEQVDEMDQQEADITDEQLANSNEPQFSQAPGKKTEAKEHTERDQLAGIHDERNSLMGQEEQLMNRIRLNGGRRQMAELWRKGFSDAVQMEGKIDLDSIADEYELTGGTIINIIQHSSLKALGRKSTTIQLNDLIQGIKREYHKNRRTL